MFFIIICIAKILLQSVYREKVSLFVLFIFFSFEREGGGGVTMQKIVINVPVLQVAKI